jgi:hypothetical protein
MQNVGRSTVRTVSHRCRQRRDRRSVVEAGPSEQCRNEPNVSWQASDFAGQRGNLIAKSIESPTGLWQFEFDMLNGRVGSGGGGGRRQRPLQKRARRADAEGSWFDTWLIDARPSMHTLQ